MSNTLFSLLRSLVVSKTASPTPIPLQAGTSHQASPPPPLLCYPLPVGALSLGRIGEGLRIRSLRNHLAIRFAPSTVLSIFRVSAAIISRAFGGVQAVMLVGVP